MLLQPTGAAAWQETAKCGSEKVTRGRVKEIKVMSGRKNHVD